MKTKQFDYAGTECQGMYKVTLVYREDNSKRYVREINRHVIPSTYGLMRAIDKYEIKSFTIELDI